MFLDRVSEEFEAVVCTANTRSIILDIDTTDVFELPPVNDTQKNDPIGKALENQHVFLCTKVIAMCDGQPWKDQTNRDNGVY